MFEIKYTTFFITSLSTGLLFTFLNVTKGKYLRMVSENQTEDFRFTELAIFLLLLLIKINLLIYFKKKYDKLKNEDA